MYTHTQLQFTQHIHTQPMFTHTLNLLLFGHEIAFTNRLFFVSPSTLLSRIIKSNDRRLGQQCHCSCANEKSTRRHSTR